MVCLSSQSDLKIYQICIFKCPTGYRITPTVECKKVYWWSVTKSEKLMNIEWNKNLIWLFSRIHLVLQHETTKIEGAIRNWKQKSVYSRFLGLALCQNNHVHALPIFMKINYLFMRFSVPGDDQFLINAANRRIVGDLFFFIIPKHRNSLILIYLLKLAHF